MKNANIFSDIAIKKTAEKIEVEVYREDMVEIEKYISFKKQSLGGEVTLAEVLSKLVRCFKLDSEYATSSPNMNVAVPKIYKKRKSPEPENAAQT